jgi:hypothetical protein
MEHRALYFVKYNADLKVVWFLPKVVGTARCAVQRRVQRRNDSHETFIAPHPFRPLLRGR